MLNPDQFLDEDLDGEFDGEIIEEADDLPWWQSREDDYLGSLWRDRGFSYGESSGKKEREAAVIAAHRMVKSFVDTFATGDTRYDVTFNPAVATAGTDLEGKKVVISPAPALDKTIDAQTAGLILTAMAVHESSHVRYGRATAAAVKRSFKGDETAARLSNLLDDVRIEQRFVADYPGYTHVFRPALDYVGKASLREMGVEIYTPTPAQPINMVAAALRYPEYADWTGQEAERDWWQDWAARGAAVDQPREHVEFIREAIAHLRTQPSQPDQGEGKDQQPTNADDKGDGEGEGGNAETSAKPAVGPTQPAEQKGDEGQAQDQWPDDEEPAEGDQFGSADGSLAACIDELIDAAAAANGVDISKINTLDLQTKILQAEVLEDPMGDGQWLGEVRRASGRKHYEQYRNVQTSPAATAMIRDAMMRSRSGFTEYDHRQKRGRCDNRSLPRIAFNDSRLFHRRNAPSPGKYLVRLLIDWSGSMAGRASIDTIAMTKALAAASRYQQNLRMEVWGWTSAQSSASGFGAWWSAHKAWETGEPLDQIERLGSMHHGGTPDAAVLRWAVKDIVKVAHRDEQPIVIMMSDGFGYGDVLLRESVEIGRKAGVKTLGVAIGAAIKPGKLAPIYGEKNVIDWQGDIVSTARPLAKWLMKEMA